MLGPEYRPGSDSSVLIEAGGFSPKFYGRKFSLEVALATLATFLSQTEHDFMAVCYNRPTALQRL